MSSAPSTEPQERARLQARSSQKAEIDAIVEAGAYAPSGHNAQAWHFTVIQDRSVLEEINAKAKGKMAEIPVNWIRAIARNPSADITHHAPLLVIVSARKDAVTGDADCAAAMQNMLIAAESLGHRLLLDGSGGVYLQ